MANYHCETYFIKFKIYFFMKLNLNDPKFVNSLVNYSWMYCFNADCPRTAECIRFISAKFKPDDVTAGNAVFPDAALD